MENRLEGIDSRLSDAERCISDLEDRTVEITHSEQQKLKKKLKMRILRDIL